MWPGEQSRVLSPNGRGGWTPLRPLRGLQETRVAPSSWTTAHPVTAPSNAPGISPLPAHSCHPSDAPNLPQPGLQRFPCTHSSLPPTAVSRCQLEKSSRCRSDDPAPLWGRARHSHLTQAEPPTPTTASRPWSAGSPRDCAPSSWPCDALPSAHGRCPGLSTLRPLWRRPPSDRCL